MGVMSPVSNYDSEPRLSPCITEQNAAMRRPRLDKRCRKKRTEVLIPNVTNSALLEVAEENIPTCDKHTARLRSAKEDPRLLMREINKDICKQVKQQSMPFCMRAKVPCCPSQRDEITHEMSLMKGPYKSTDRRQLAANYYRKEPHGGLYGFLCMKPWKSFKKKIDNYVMFPWFNNDPYPVVHERRMKRQRLGGKIERRLLELEAKVSPLTAEELAKATRIVDNLEDLVIDHQKDQQFIESQIETEYNQLTDEDIAVLLRFLLDANYQRGMSDAEQPLYSKIIREMVILQLLHNRFPDPAKQMSLSVRLSKLSRMERENMEIMLLKETGIRDRLLKDIQCVSKENDVLLKKTIENLVENQQMIGNIHEKMEKNQFNCLPRDDDVEEECRKAIDKEASFHDACMRLEDLEIDWNTFRLSIQCVLNGLVGYWKPQCGFLWLLVEAISQYIECCPLDDPILQQFIEVQKLVTCDFNGMLQQSILKHELVGLINDFYDKVEVLRHWAYKDHGDYHSILAAKKRKPFACCKTKKRDDMCVHASSNFVADAHDWSSSSSDCPSPTYD